MTTSKSTSTAWNTTTVATTSVTTEVTGDSGGDPAPAGTHTTSRTTLWEPTPGEPEVKTTSWNTTT
jgi:hypothetical protein